MNKLLLRTYLTEKLSSPKNLKLFAVILLVIVLLSYLPLVGLLNPIIFLKNFILGDPIGVAGYLYFGVLIYGVLNIIDMFTYSGELIVTEENVVSNKESREGHVQQADVVLTTKIEGTPFLSKIRYAEVKEKKLSEEIEEKKSSVVRSLKRPSLDEFKISQELDGESEIAVGNPLLDEKKPDAGGKESAGKMEITIQERIVDVDSAADAAFLDFEDQRINETEPIEDQNQEEEKEQDYSVDMDLVNELAAENALLMAPEVIGDKVARLGDPEEVVEISGQIRAEGEIELSEGEHGNIAEEQEVGEGLPILINEDSKEESADEMEQEIRRMLNEEYGNIK